MNGRIHVFVAVLGLAANAAVANAEDPGPYGKKTLYDRCWPQRYANLSQRAVNRALTPQVQNGHVLDQTIWNHMFEPGTDVLTPLGQAHLQYVSRRRPEVDPTVFLATAMDLTYDPACPERYCGARQELDALRVAAIQKFLNGLNCGRCTAFQVLVHDPADVTIHATPAATMVTGMWGAYRGSLRAGAGGAVGTTTGGVTTTTVPVITYGSGGSGTTGGSGTGTGTGTGSGTSR